MENLNNEGGEQALVRSPKAGQIARRDFAGSSLAVGSAATDALAAKARADVEARWIMAQRMPRNLDDVRQQVIYECKNPEFAKAAVYARPVGNGQVAEGLSIRFAEMACRAMGNLSVETMTIYDSDESRITRVTVTDFESNATWARDLSIRKTVERKQLKKGQRPLGERVNSYGDRVFIVEATDDEVMFKESNLVSKASRTGVLRLVPGHIQREAMALCKQVVQDKAAKDPDGERKKILDAFAILRVLPSDLEMYLGHPTTQLVPVEIERLRSIYQAIADGETSWREILDAVLEARAEAKPANAAPNAQTAPTTQAGAPPTSQQAPAEAPPPKPKRGAAGLKDQLKNDAKPPAADPPKEPTAFDKAAADARAKDATRVPTEHENGGALNDEQRASVAAPAEDPKCVDCGVPVIEPGRCYACSQA